MIPGGCSPWFQAAYWLMLALSLSQTAYTIWFTRKTRAYRLESSERYVKRCNELAEAYNLIGDLQLELAKYRDNERATEVPL